MSQKEQTDQADQADQPDQPDQTNKFIRLIGQINQMSGIISKLNTSVNFSAANVCIQIHDLNHQIETLKDSEALKQKMERLKITELVITPPDTSKCETVCENIRVALDYIMLNLAIVLINAGGLNTQIEKRFIVLDKHFMTLQKDKSGKNETNGEVVNDVNVVKNVTGEVVYDETIEVVHDDGDDNDDDGDDDDDDDMESILREFQD